MQDQYVNDIEIKFSSFVKLTMILFSSIFVFAGITPYPEPKYVFLLNKIFIQGFLHSSFFSIFEIVFIILALILLLRFGSRYNNASSISKFIFIFIIINFILKMINPNNDTSNPILGIPLFSDISNFSFILLAYFSLFLEEKAYIFFLKKLFYYIGVILTIRVFFLFFMFVIGKGFQGLGANSTSGESDLLFLIAFYQIVFFVLYLIYKKKKYLILCIIYFLFQVLSYRRSALAVALFANAFTYIFILLREKGVKNKTLLVLGVIFIFLAINNIEKFNLPLKYQNYILRFTSAIPGMAISETGDFNDSGHLEQTKTTFSSAIKSLGFWGKGYGRSRFIYLSGQSLVIHNPYAATWITYGLYMLFFYVFLFLILLYYFFRLLFVKYKNWNHFLLKLSLTVFLIMFFIVISTNGLMDLEHIKMEMFWFTPLTLLLRLNDKNINLLFKKSKT